jgi:hypothetical protein
VHVEAEQNGEKLVEERQVTLVGGQRHELKFDLADESTRLVALE